MAANRWQTGATCASSPPTPSCSPCIKVPGCLSHVLGMCTRSGRGTASSSSFRLPKDGVVGWGWWSVMVTCGHRSRIVTSADWAQGLGSGVLHRCWDGSEDPQPSGLEAPLEKLGQQSPNKPSNFASCLVDNLGSRACRTSESRGRLREQEESHHCLQSDRRRMPIQPSSSAAHAS